MQFNAGFRPQQNPLAQAFTAGLQIGSQLGGAQSPCCNHNNAPGGQFGGQFGPETPPIGLAGGLPQFAGAPQFGGQQAGGGMGDIVNQLMQTVSQGLGGLLGGQQQSPGLGGENPLEGLLNQGGQNPLQGANHSPDCGCDEGDQDVQQQIQFIMLAIQAKQGGQQDGQFGFNLNS